MQQLKKQKKLIELVSTNFCNFTKKQRLGLVSYLYSILLSTDFSEELRYFVPPDFIQLSTLAANHLLQNGK